MRLTKWLVTMPALLLSTLVNGQTPEQPRLAINLNVYAGIEINRPASAVWPFIVDTNSWKPDRPMVHHSGPTGQLGEVFAIVTPQHPEKIWFLAEDVELVHNERRTIKLLSVKGDLLGFASWGLTEKDGKTWIDYQIHAESRVTPDMKPEVLAEQQRTGYASNKKRVDDELVELKRRLEAGQ